MQEKPPCLVNMSLVTRGQWRMIKALSLWGVTVTVAHAGNCHDTALRRCNSHRGPEDSADIHSRVPTDRWHVPTACPRWRVGGGGRLRLRSRDREPGTRCAAPHSSSISARRRSKPSLLPRGGAGAGFVAPVDAAADVAFSICPFAPGGKACNQAAVLVLRIDGKTPSSAGTSDHSPCKSVLVLA